MVTDTTSKTSEQLENYLKALFEQQYFNGSVLVAKAGIPLLNKGYGTANLEHDVLNMPYTKFRIGSITKQFTAAAVLLLQEQGLLHVDDPVNKHVTDYPNGDMITIHHLLTHTSGIPNMTNFPEFRESVMRQELTLEKLIALFKDKELDFTPGVKFNYSNSGYVLLTHILEAASGIPFERYFSENIFLPLGMNDSGIDSHRKILKHRASGFAVWGDLIHDDFIDMSIPCGAGALYSTVNDLFIWDQALNSDRLLSKSSRDQMFTPYIGVPFPESASYGYGVFVTEASFPTGEKRNTIEHGGGINGFHTNYCRYVDDEVTVIVFSNVIPAQVGQITKDLASIVFGEKIDLPSETKRIQDVDPAQLSVFVGDYIHEHEQWKTKLSVTLEEEKLYLTHDRFLKVELVPIAIKDSENRSRFASRRIQGEVTFIHGDNGEADQVEMNIVGAPKLLADKS